MKKILSIILIAILSLTLYGCAPKGDPLQVITNYYQTSKDGNIDAAYSDLAPEATKTLSKEDFALYHSLLGATEQFKSFKIAKVADDKNNVINGITFKNIAAFDVTETVLSYYDNKEQSVTSRQYVVGDSGTWKMYRTISKSDIAGQYGMLGQMYNDGKGKDKNLVQAVENFKKALEVDNTAYRAHYALGVAYLDMQRYDDSIQEEKLYIDKSTDNKEKSSALNVIALDYVNKNDLTNAKSYFSQALSLDPDNEYAKNNMDQYIK